MPGTSKLSEGIIGVTVCLIILLAAALPIMGALISTVDDGEPVPAQVTASGTNDASLSDAYALLKPSNDAYRWHITGVQETDDVALTYYKNSQQYDRILNPDGFRLLVSVEGGFHGVIISLEGDKIVTAYSNTQTIFTLSSEETYIDITFRKVSGSPTVEVMRYAGAQDQEWVNYTDVNWVFAKAWRSSGGSWMAYSPTHGFVSGSPGAFLGTGSAFHFGTTESRSTVIDLTPARLDQRVFMLDDGRVFDLDDPAQPIKDLTAYKETKGDERIGGPVLKTSRALTRIAVEFSADGSEDVLSAQDAGYVGTWTDVPFDGGLQVPRLDSVQSGADDVTGWYVPLKWTYTGTGTVVKHTMIYSVLSVMPLILLVALFVLIVRWIQSGFGERETSSFLGRSGKARDGWRDRR